ncbi:hypothetical protein [Oceanospirillum sanctuarii]|uniref:hypothetical protein n=1 Tax=Oceanospirillum sanctuarii TaxID=1434821 RepID=UPI000A3857A2|nr:hypothetical protein [Oceanospirillum sanctuarii]
MSRYHSKTSPELREVLQRWQEERKPEDAEWLADQMPHLLEDVARVQAGFIALRGKVKKLEAEMQTYRQTRLLAEFDDDNKH